MIKKIKNKTIQILRYQEELLLGKRILKNSRYASPDFMIIGTPKSGTTSLFQYLAQHSKTIPSKEKELLYFSVRQGKGLRWYLQNFPLKSKKNGCLSYEGSPSYIYYINGLNRIKRLFSNIKLIILLRDPVKRAFSQWNYNQEGSPFLIKNPHAKDDRSFREAINDEIRQSFRVTPLHQYVYRSLYAKHLKNVYKIFRHDQILVLDFENLKNNPQKTLTIVTNFLGLDSVYHDFQKSDIKKEGLLQTKDSDKSRKLKAYNVNQYKQEIDPETEKFLQGYFKPFDKEIIEITGQKFSWMD